MQPNQGAQPPQQQQQPQAGQPMYGYQYPYPQYGQPYPMQPGQPGMPQPYMQPGMPYQQMPGQPIQYPPMQGQPMPGMPQPMMGQPMMMMQPQPGVMACGKSGYPMLVPRGPVNPQIHQMTQVEAEMAASELYGAFKGIGADHSAVIKVLSTHNKVQLSAIASAYFSKYGKTLESRIKSELTGNYESLALALLRPPYYMESAFLKKAILDPENVDHNLISSIVMTRTSMDFGFVCAAGETTKREKPKKKDKQKKNIGQEIVKAEGNYATFQTLLRTIMNTRREVGPVNPTQVSADARDLIIAAKGIGCDAKPFIQMFCTRSWAHIRAVATEVEKQKKTPLKKLIYKEFTGTMEIALVTLLNMATSPAHGVAYAMYRAMKGLGTDDATLIACIAYIYDNDMLDKVKEAFLSIAGKDLVKYVESETSLHYKKLCVALLNYKGKKHLVEMNNGY